MHNPENDRRNQNCRHRFHPFVNEPFLDNSPENDLFKNYQVTTYTYDPLVGVRSVTPPSGIREYYFYDDSKRLQSIKIREKNSSGIEVFKILKEYKYNYKP